MRPIASVLWRGLDLIQKWQAPINRRNLGKYDSRLPATIYVRRAVSLLALLEKYQPRSIVELGSGESSGWFAAYASKHPGTKVLSIDEWPEWQSRETRVAQQIGGVEFQIAKKIHEPPNGWHYDIDLPEADFVFVDGPYHQTQDAGMDVPHMLKRGLRPKVICVDGRTTGVDVLRTMTPDYEFFPQMIWCFERNTLLPAVAMRQHSVFVRR